MAGNFPIGVLAFQGDVREHLNALEAIGHKAIPVKTLAELNSISGLILPGGESTTIHKLSVIFELFNPIREKIHAGFPVFGTCAGLILLSDRILGGIEGQETFGGLDVTVRRNAFGHQVDSFEAVLDFAGIERPIHAAFIRAPLIEEVGSKATTVCQLDDGRIVGVQQENLLGISFHPEVTGEYAVHELFAQVVASA
ncbi:MAG: pyridoxal 5'-phosphate synthase glutaminase subunit PdxT [Micrococcales bacterium]